MMTIKDPSQEALQEVFEVRDGCIWRKAFVGRDGRKLSESVVENVANTSEGYCAVGFKGRKVRYHRILWILVNGEIPAGLVVDHKDGNKINNDINNLRLLTQRENMQNRYYHRTGKLCGVHWNKLANRWYTQIWVGNKNINLGYFNTELEAFDAYIQANVERGLSVWLLEEHRELYLQKASNKAVV